MSARERMTLAAALAVALGSSALMPLYSDSHWLGQSLLAVLAIALAGLLARRWAVPLVLQPLITTAALVGFTCWAFARATLTYGLIPTRQTWTTLHALFSTGLTDIDRMAPPVPSKPGLTLIAVLGVGAVAISVDLIAVVLGRAAVAGLPLLALFAVPSAVLPGGIGWLPFALGSAGWLGLMLLEGNDRIGRWGTPTHNSVSDASLGRVGRRIGAAALGVAIVLPAILPGLDGRLLGGHGGGGDGAGSGGSTTTTYNPITRLRDDLRLPKERTVLTYRTSAEQPDYLRMTTLDVFSDTGWSSSKLTGDIETNGVDGTLPPPIGLTSADADTVAAEITIRNLDAHWLPVPAVPSRVYVDGPWLYDQESETVFGIRTTTQRLKGSYRVTAVHATPTGALLATESTQGPDPTVQAYAADPGPEVTNPVRELTRRIVAGKPTPYDQVAALQAFFTSPGNGFQYSESTKVAGINSPSALEDFLNGRRGFCEQYASAMAAMVRVVGVPARVAVGFTAGTKQSDGSYKVTTKDAHAWPEAWFAGSGWVRFEPTPRADGQTTVPAYTDGSDAQAPGADGNGNDPGGTSSATAAEQKLALQSKLDNIERTGPAGGATPAGHRRSGGAPLTLIALLAVIALAAAPRLLHVLRQRRRWHGATGSGIALAAWQQLYDDARDLGHVWRPADSPRAAAAHLAKKYALPQPAREALARLTAAAERARYARSGLPGDSVGTDLSTVITALRSGTGPTRRWAAWLLPPSTLLWAYDAVADWADARQAQLDDLRAGLRRRVHPA